MTEQAMSPLRPRMIEDLGRPNMTTSKGSRASRRSLADRPTRQASKTFAAANSIWPRAALPYRPSTKAMRRCGSSSGSRLNVQLLWLVIPLVEPLARSPQVTSDKQHRGHYTIRLTITKTPAAVALLISDCA